MNIYKIADLLVAIGPQYALSEKRLKPYQTDNKFIDFEIKLTEEDYRKVNPNLNDLSRENLEYLLLGSRFHKNLLRYDGVMLHSSAVVLDGYAYLFSAPSGTGKSTHTQLWQKYFGQNRALIINDDKPSMRIINGKIMTYGTPFSGKHEININMSAELGAICFLERAEKNSIAELEINKAIVEFLNQTIRPPQMKQMDRLLEIMEAIFINTKIYKLCCDMSFEAVETAYNAIKRQ